MDEQIYAGAKKSITYLKKLVELTITDTGWTGSSGRAWAADKDGKEYAAYFHTLNKWPPDWAWQRVNRQAMRVA